MLAVQPTVSHGSATSIIHISLLDVCTLLYSFWLSSLWLSLCKILAKHVFSKSNTVVCGGVHPTHAQTWKNARTHTHNLYCTCNGDMLLQMTSAEHSASYWPLPPSVTCQDKNKSKAKLSRYYQIDAKGEKSYSSYSFLTSALDGGEGSVSHPRYPLNRRLGGPQSWSGYRG
jgi:hypothetical protein